MATKNKNLTYNVGALFEEFTSSLGLSQSEKNELLSLPAKIESEVNNLTELERIATSIQTEVDAISDTRTNDEIQIDIDTIKNTINIVKHYEDLNSKLTELESKATLTRAETTQKTNISNELTSIADSSRAEMEDFALRFSAGSVDDMIDFAKDYINSLEIILDKHDELRIANENVLNKRNEIAIIMARKAELEEKETLSSVPSLENFKSFLEDNNLSTNHAEEIYNYQLNPNENPLEIKSKDFKMRKSHPKRDAFIKKVLIPAAVTGAGIGAVVGAIAGSGLIGGSTVLGFIPVSGTPGMTAMATSMVGALTGLVATPIVIKTKNALTKAYYKLAYKKAKKNLKEYKNGTSLDSLYITKLIEKIQKTKESVLNMNQGNWLTRKLKFIPKHYLNAINRNRIHHLEAYTKDLVEMYNIIDHNNVEDKNERLKPIYELLKQVDSFVSSDIEESKIYAMLTCKDSKKHSHVSTIENIDIFANLAIYINSITESSPKDKKLKIKESKASSKNLRHKKEIASSILNGKRLIERMVAGYENSLTGETIADIHDNDEIFEIDEVIEETPIETIDEITEEILDGTVEEIHEEATEETIEEGRTALIFECVDSHDHDPSEHSAESIVFTFEEDDERTSEEVDENLFEVSEVIKETPDELSEEIVTEAREEIPAETIVVTAEDAKDISSTPKSFMENMHERDLISEETETSEDTINTSSSVGTLVRKTTQRLKYSTTALTLAGETVGVKLVVEAKGSKDATEIRYLASKKKIRIKSSDGEKFVPVTDTIIPPINQINEILKDIAKDKQIDHADALTIS